MPVSSPITFFSAFSQVDVNILLVLAKVDDGRDGEDSLRVDRRAAWPGGGRKKTSIFGSRARGHGPY